MEGAKRFLIFLILKNQLNIARQLKTYRRVPPFPPRDDVQYDACVHSPTFFFFFARRSSFFSFASFLANKFPAFSLLIRALKSGSTLSSKWPSLKKLCRSRSEDEGLSLGSSFKHCWKEEDKSTFGYGTYNSTICFDLRFDW